jgi:nitrate/TMAO reductase-like tetraheme cytochrome c subunit
MRKFDQNTGKRMSRPVLQKYDRKVWAAQRRWLESTGHTIIIVHDPTKYAAAKVVQQAQSEASRKAAERAAMKAELMRELKAEREAMKAELLAEIKAENAKTEKVTKKSKK